MAGVLQGWRQNRRDGTDITFSYIDDAGVVQSGLVEFSGNSPQADFLDINFDGSIDNGDWLDFADGLGGKYPSLSPAESYREGDLNGDLVTNFTDFRIFQTEYDFANGASSFQAMVDNLQAVPEPTTSLLLLVTAVGLAAGVRSK